MDNSIESHAFLAGAEHGFRRFRILSTRRIDIGMDVPPEFLGKRSLPGAWIAGQAEGYTIAMRAREECEAEMVDGARKEMDKLDAIDPLGLFTGEYF